MILICPNCDSRFKINPKALGDRGRKVKCQSCNHVWHQEPRAETEADEPAAAPAAPSTGKPAPAKSAKESAPDEFEDHEGSDGEETPEPREHDVEDFAAAMNMADDESGRAAGDVDEDDSFDDGGKKKRRFRLGFGWIRGIGRIVPRFGGPLPWLGVIVFTALVGGGTYYMAKPIARAWPPSTLLFETIGIKIPSPAAGLQLRNVTSEKRMLGDVPVVALLGDVANLTEQPLEIPRLAGFIADTEGGIVESWPFELEERIIEPGEALSFITQTPVPPQGGALIGATFLNEFPE